MILLIACLFLLVCYKWGGLEKLADLLSDDTVSYRWGLSFTIMLQEQNCFGNIPINCFLER